MLPRGGMKAAKSLGPKPLIASAGWELPDAWPMFQSICRLQARNAEPARDEARFLLFTGKGI